MYDTMKAYYDNEAARIEEATRAAQKTVADEAVKELQNFSTSDTVKTAYAQKERFDKNINSETNAIRNLANTEKIKAQTDLSNYYINEGLKNEADKIKADTMAREADIEKKFDTSQADYDLAKASIAENQAVDAERLKNEQTAGYMESLMEIARQNGYEYDFDADIFELEQMGFGNNDWQIQYLKEAKRRQSKLKPKKTSSDKLPKKSEEPKSEEPKADPKTTESTTRQWAADTLSGARMEGTVEQIAAEESDKAVSSLRDEARSQLEYFTSQYENGEIGADEYKKKLTQLGLTVDAFGYIRKA